MSPATDVARVDDLHPRAVAGLAFVAGFYFSARSILGLLAVRVLGAGARVASEAMLALSLALLCAAAFDAFGVSSRTTGSILRVLSVRWVLAFLIFSGFSLAWSGTVSLSTSVAYWCELAADVAVVVLLFRAGRTMNVAHSLMKGFIWSTCCLAVVAWMMPTQADLRLGDEDLFNTNQIGNLCALGAFMGQYLMRRKDGKWGPATTFLVVTLFRSLSKTTIVAFLVSESVLLIQDRSLSRKSKILLTTMIIAFILVFWGLFEAYYDLYTTSGSSAETLTGRTAIWIWAWGEAIEKPWTGHGFDAMWKVAPLFGNGFEARHAENEVLQQFYAYGVAGVTLLIGIYGSLYWKLRRVCRGPVKMIFVSLLIFIIVRGIAEAEPFDLLLPLWFVVVTGMIVEHEETPVRLDEGSHG